MSNDDQDNSSNSNSGAKSEISPDPRITISSSKLKPITRDLTDETGEKSRTTVTFTLEQGGTWSQSVDGEPSAPYEPNNGEGVTVNGAEEDPKYPDKTIPRLVDVTIIDDTGTYKAAEAYKRKDLDGNPAEFKLTAAVGASFDFRLDAGMPTSHSYYIQSRASPNLFATVDNGTIVGSSRNAHVESRWVIFNRPNSHIAILSLSRLSWASNDSDDQIIGLVSSFGDSCLWNWDSTNGVIFNDASQSNYWTAPGASGGAITLNYSTWDQNQKWNLVPVS